MSKIRIVTDSTSDIPLEICQQLQIEIVPLKIQFGSDTFIDRVTIQPDEFYKKLAQSSKLPTTSQPSPQEFLNVYQEMLSEPDVEIISIHISSRLSGTVQSARIAASMTDNPSSIHIFDSLSVSIGLGQLAIIASEEANKGKSVAEIIDLLKKGQENSHILFLLDTLENLQKGGRIGKASAFVGSLLNVKPILSIDQEGQVFAKDKARGQQKSLNRLVELIEELVPSKKIHLHLAISDNKQRAEELYQLIADRVHIESVTYISLSPVIGTHTGPGVVAAIFRPA
jgi:DegV family protein with EDD domain